MIAPLPLYTPEHRDGILPIAYFHALARLGFEGLVIVEPARHFMSIGAFGDATKVIDLAYCRDTGIPVMRREVGGGAVLLGPGQVFYNLVVRRDARRVPRKIEDAYRVLSQAPVGVYADVGITARYRPVNDLVTESEKKIAGQGAGDIGECFCFVGSILNRFDVALMARALRIDDEAVRARVRTAMDANMSWIERERGAPAAPELIAASLARRFGEIIPLATTATPLPAAVMALARTLAHELTGADALQLDAGRAYDAVKIREGVYVSLKG